MKKEAKVSDKEASEASSKHEPKKDDAEKAAKAKVQPEVKRIYRSNRDKVVAGVCGGIAEYLNIDPVWARLVAVLLLFADGVGILLYIIAWILIPKNPMQKGNGKTTAESAVEKVTAKAEKRIEGQGSSMVGIVLIVVGAVFLMRKLVPWFNMGYVWPFAIIAIGVYLLVSNNDRKKE